jgi:translation initiation factor IF-2
VSEEDLLKVRIFSLAKELDIDSKVLIQHCADAGLDVKNSPLASITEEERDRLMAHLKTVGREQPAVQEPVALVPTREESAAERMGRVRQIKTLGPLGGMRSRRSREEEEAEAAFADVEAPVVEEPVEEPAEPEEATVAEAPRHEPEAEETPAVEAPAEEAPPAAAETPVPVEQPAPQPSRTAPISRSDYVAPGGHGHMGMSDMKARGSIRDLGAGARRKDKPTKKTAALPNVALPNFKPPVPAAKKSEGPAQKPEVRITGEVLKGTKLSDFIRKKKEEHEKPEIEEETGRPRKGGGKPGLTLDDMRQRRKKRGRSSGDDDEDGGLSRGKVRRQRRSSGPVTRKTSASVAFPLLIRDFCEEIGRTSKEVLGALFRTGQMMTLNDSIDEPLGLELGMELGVDIEIVERETVEDILRARLDQTPEELGVEAVARPPIVTVLGHVDHGKTTLVDRIRSANVAAGEAGGITQHIAAYQVPHNDQKITFVDTPGHAAFGEMRARGANVTDIVVLVVAADDGVMPQTVECISHAKAAGVPIIVALNKIDLPDVNEQRILTELSQHGVLPSEWGGDTEVVRVSALQGTGIDNLLETILLTAELQEFQAPEAVAADGVCLEAFRHEGRGPLAWMIVRQGVLRIGDNILCGSSYGRVRAMYNDRDEEIQEAGPSMPCKVAGLNDVPRAGDHFFVMHSVDDARGVAEQREAQGRTESLARRGGLRSLEDFFAQRDGQVRELPLIVKADTPGSIEALRHEIGKFEHPEVRVKILHDAVGGVNESDVYLAASSGAIIIAFHVIPEDRAMALAEHEGVEIRRYNIIYNVTDEIRQALEGLLKPERVEITTGRALVLRTFSISRTGTIAGCRVLNGTIERSNRVHVIRDQTILNDYALASLRREKDDVREVREGMECGIRLEGFNDIKEGDLLEAFRIEERKRSLKD